MESKCASYYICQNYFFMIRSILLVSLLLVMTTSILAPTGILLSDLKIVMLDVNDTSEEETNSGEKEVSEKEIIDHTYPKDELFIFIMNAELYSFIHDNGLKRASDIFLPPPEFI